MEQRDLEAAKQKPEIAKKESDKKSIGRGDLCLVEDILFRGGSREVDGKLLGRESLIAQLGQEENYGNVRTKFLTAQGFLLQNRTIDQINERRMGEVRLMAFPAFDVSQLVALSFENKYPYIKLESIDNNGQVSGEWKVGLIELIEKPVEGERFPDFSEKNLSEIDASELKLDEDLAGHFTLSKDPDGKGQILKLNLNHN